MKRLSLVTLTLAVACGGSATTDSTTVERRATTTEPGSGFPSPPLTPDGPLDPPTSAALDEITRAVFSTDLESEHIDDLADPRVAWVLADLMRFYQTGPVRDELVPNFQRLTGLAEGPQGELDFVWAFNHLIAWDLPAWDGYAEAKRVIYTQVDERWAVFFDEDHGVDWRLVTWGGVLADDRPFGDNGPCNCIPALDDPAMTDAAAGTWYKDEAIVFGVIVGGEPLALPKHQMEVHEMVNLTLGGRHLGIPYCTLCGSAQAYYTDNVPGVDRVVLRTSGLLSRSNKVMYDLTTKSVFNTFTGEALTGPLGEQGLVLEQVSVVASTWGDWKLAHPDTRIIAEDGGIGRRYPEDPLGGRDDFGPIFPVGDVDPRLPVQEPVVGVITPSGTPVAFPVAAVRGRIQGGEQVTFEGLEVRIEDGVRVYDASGAELTSHQAYWFAWSQFHPGTLVWSVVGG